MRAQLFLRFVSSVLCAFSATLSPQVLAQPLGEPFSAGNRGPFAQLFGLQPALSAQMPARDSQRWRLSYEVASNATQSNRGDELILLDGETERLELGWRYGFSQRWSVALNLPYISHSEGFLDGFIDDWHGFFGFPDGDRDKLPVDHLDYRYRKDNKTLVSIQERSSGAGDLGLELVYGLKQSSSRISALRFSVKLPTGDADRLLGSGSTDLGLGVLWSELELFGREDLNFHAAASAVYLSSSDIGIPGQRHWLVQGSSTISWLARDYLSFKLQLDAHSGLYDSELTELGNPSVQLLMGGSLALSDRWVLDLSVSEDIAVRTAPDVVFQLALRADF